ncbi:Dabb family protein [Aureliella helgolandensis]|uniref:Stress responsive A/B Barrel Domain protein n=1 Tax=Aureliella helgolandensis TaxID=2527968 RepID=A0A518G5T0_9BACT|nr:Stress responsive A/B Barrel Domain protein [Aureliella helgolandensis]
MVTSTRPVAADSSDSKHLRHVVMFQFKDASSEQDVQKVVDAFRALPKKIPVIADFEFGTNNSPEGLEDGFTHCFLVTFKSEADREVYLPHEAHQAFVEVLKPHLEKVMVIDYWAGK